MSAELREADVWRRETESASGPSRRSLTLDRLSEP
jgi:hypothetical protein